MSKPSKQLKELMKANVELSALAESITPEEIATWTPAERAEVLKASQQYREAVATLAAQIATPTELAAIGI